MMTNEPRITWAEGEPPTDYEAPVLLRLSKAVCGCRYHVGRRMGSTWIVAGRFLWDCDGVRITHHAFTNEPEGVEGD